MATHTKHATVPGRGRGRPSPYKPELCDIARKCMEQDYTLEELAEVLCVTMRTLTNWKNKFLEFQEALKEGRSLNEARLRREGLQFLRSIAEQAVQNAAQPAPYDPRPQPAALPRTSPKPEPRQPEPRWYLDTSTDDAAEPVPMEDPLKDWH